MFKDRLLEVKRKLWEEINSPSEDKTVSLESFLNFLQSQVEIEGVVPKTNKDKPVRPVKECLPAANLFSAPALVTKTNDPEASCDRTDTLCKQMERRLEKRKHSPGQSEKKKRKVFHFRAKD
ncbi:hypothetical protein M514_12493 [Trichuris suis]|uniref:Uncharacterized protein n=1 Tax=Trichuris suis TaxID=68888 RepID=A0A085LNU2_9BILA|nr:hypothetical protein M513_12493 [Trichuris suis]KFD61506.1 hypothetical protein M514_12493 [Trichuris suis]